MKKKRNTGRRNGMRGLFLCLVVLTFSHGVRIKDAASVAGLGEMQIIGFGLVVGLRNTGDGPQAIFTTKGVVNMLRNLGIQVPQSRVRVRNVAAVMVVADFPVFAKKGSRLDVGVSSIGDARSLEGGTLLMTPLSAPDGKIYAMAQGPIAIGGFDRESGTGLTAFRKNHTGAGTIPNGAVVQRKLAGMKLSKEEFRYVLHTPDFSSALNMMKAVNAHFDDTVALAEDASTVRVRIPDIYMNGPAAFLAEVESVDFTPSAIARVVLNEKTGTIVAGGDIVIEPVAVSHGSITIAIETSRQASGTVSQMPGSTLQSGMASASEQAEVREPKADVKLMPRVTNVNELAAALTSLGVPPRDIIAIFQSIKKAGALHADLVLM